jgi:hypothetical protein
MAGNHAGGAARQAKEQFGAEDGVGEGMTGQCYAFPTLDWNFEKRTFAQLNVSRCLLYQICREHPDKQFLLTKVGCGIAGYNESDIRELFTNPKPPVNLVLPEDWQ